MTQKDVYTLVTNSLTKWVQLWEKRAKGRGPPELMLGWVGLIILTNDLQEETEASPNPLIALGSAS